MQISKLRIIDKIAENPFSPYIGQIWACRIIALTLKSMVRHEKMVLRYSVVAGEYPINFRKMLCLNR
jgi:hypothetical protein